MKTSTGIVKTAESKILPNCREKQSCNVCKKAAECKQKKVERKQLLKNIEKQLQKCSNNTLKHIYNYIKYE